MKAQYRAGKRLWSAADDAKLRRIYPDHPTSEVARRLRRTLASVYGRANLLRAHKSAAYLASPAACRLRRGDNVGWAYRYSKGHVPANKGLRRPGWSPGRMKETQFKKGHRSRWMSVGSTRLVDGYVYRKVTDVPHVPWTRNWVVEHVRVWTEANGPLLPGHAVAFKNGDRTDIRLENFECISRRELMARNSIHNLPKPIAEALQLLGALKRQIRQRTSHAAEKQDRRSP